MILLTYGTRPEFIKLKPLMDEMRKTHIPFKVLFTGQHKDYDNGADFRITFKDFGLNRLDNILQNCLNLPDEWLQDINYILVQGDTTSVLALSLMAMHRKIKIIHLEAGLRSYDYDNPYPEEYNRTLVTKLASIHLCPTEQNKANLVSENVSVDTIHVVGNTALDNLIEYRDKCEYTNKILVTLHRRENHDKLKDWFDEINKIAKVFHNYEFIVPLHPNPIIKEQLPKNPVFTIIEPLDHKDLISLLAKSSLVITDSGGIQEECSFLNKKCLVCRKTTERPEALGLSSFLVTEPKLLKHIFTEHIKTYHINIKSPYGNGNSSKII